MKEIYEKVSCNGCDETGLISGRTLLCPKCKGTGKVMILLPGKLDEALSIINNRISNIEDRLDKIISAFQDEVENG
jgi:RecJ-like exonuclease